MKKFIKTIIYTNEKINIFLENTRAQSHSLRSRHT